MIAICAEPTVNCTESAHSGAIKPLQRPYPQFKIRVNRILDKHTHPILFAPGQTGNKISDFLHSKRICRSSRPYPDRAYAGSERIAQMSRRGYLRHRSHVGFLADLGQPGQCLGPDTLERPRACTRFPYSRPEISYPRRSQFLSCAQRLRTRLGTARPGNDDRRSALKFSIEDRNQIFEFNHKKSYTTKHQRFPDCFLKRAFSLTTPSLPSIRIAEYWNVFASPKKTTHNAPFAATGSGSSI